MVATSQVNLNLINLTKIYPFGTLEIPFQITYSNLYWPNRYIKTMEDCKTLVVSCCFTSRVTQKEWYFRDDCTEFVWSVFLHSGFLVGQSWIICVLNHLVNHQMLNCTLKPKSSFKSSYFYSFGSSLHSHHLMLTLYLKGQILISNLCFISQSFLGYRCKSSISIFAWRVT